MCPHNNDKLAIMSKDFKQQFLIMDVNLKITKRSYIYMHTHITCMKFLDNYQVQRHAYSVAHTYCLLERLRRELEADISLILRLVSISIGMSLWQIGFGMEA